MLLLRRSDARGRGEFPWLKTFYTFSFAGYYNPHYMGFRSLRVLNEDVIAPGKGFPTHAHSDMEILTLVLSGCVEHKDSMGHTRRIRSGEVQAMTAGTGVQHSEFNPGEEPLHLLQIWIEPAEFGLSPRYQEASLAMSEHGLFLVAAPLGQEAPVTLQQDVWLWQGRVSAGKTLDFDQKQKDHQWIHVIEGDLTLNGSLSLSGGDGVAVSRESELRMTSAQGARFLVFDLA